MTAYEKLKERFSEISNLGGASSVLLKEMEISMPAGSAQDRINQVMAIGTAIHTLITDPQVKLWLDEAQAQAASLSAEDRRNLELMHHSWVHRAFLSRDLSREVSRLGSEGEQRHSQNYTSGDWNTMKDWYRHSFDIARAVGEAKKSALGVKSAYEALLDQFSPGLREATVEREFSLLEKELAPLIKEAQAKQKAQGDPLPLQGPFPFEQVEELCNRVVAAMGFDFSRGRFDLTRDHHPSCGGTSDDTRMTSRYKADDFLDAVFAAIHEAGHGLYSQNLPKAWRYQPAGSDQGMALHESQSMIWELQACKTPEFFQYLEREARAVFGRPNDKSLSADNMMKLMTRVEPSFIRIEADEMTYPAHIVLRWRLEKSIIEGKLDVADLPRAWNDGMKQLLGIVPPDPSKGCMQDVHWPGGMQGYFPSYTLGAMGAAQLFAAACKARPELRGELAKGNCKPLHEWLRDNVHAKGCLIDYDAVFVAATGEKLNAAYYLNHLSERYLGKSWTGPQKTPQAGPVSNKRPHGPSGP